jgi:hypothetical protein
VMEAAVRIERTETCGMRTSTVKLCLEQGVQVEKGEDPEGIAFAF